MWRVEIDINECDRIYEVVGKIGYNAAKLFPGYDGVAKKLEEDAIYRDFCRNFEVKKAKNMKIKFRPRKLNPRRKFKK